MNKRERYRIHVYGQVQGIGFRPAIYRYARELSLAGWVANISDGVVIEIEGIKKNIELFFEKLEESIPVLSEISTIKREKIHLRKEDGFVIKPSSGREKGKFTLIPPDICICEDCRKELFTEGDRRFKYPFINCSVCGPRFTIIQDIPYDRKKTTMKKFKMCETCLSEYSEPENRRFHAEPNACPECGPDVMLVENNENFKKNIVRLASVRRDKLACPEDICNFSYIKKGNDAIEHVVELLKSGKIIAVKGVGGFHLACDAANGEAVSRLRSRKYREDKPFAVMAKDVNTVREYCKLNKEEELLITSRTRPVILLEKLNNIRNISESIAQNNNYLGFMLPYTPLHYELFKNGSPEVLVMTSGNISDEPICYTNEEAFDRLRGIADFFLINNRDIHVRCDDSVIRVFPLRHKGKCIPLMIRRSRGYVPLPVRIDIRFKKPILACGAHLKNTFCLAKNEYAFISHHIGDLENIETIKAFENGIEHFKNLFSIKPEIAVCDLHPEYLSTKYAVKLAEDRKIERLIKVQHHHAHIASCMAENNILNRKVIGVAFDGLGYGDDGKLWGGEFFVCSLKNYKRAAHLKYMPLPGGENAIKEPWRMGISYLYETFGTGYKGLDIDFLKSIRKKDQSLLLNLIDKRINTLQISSVGRLYDGVSAILNIRHKNNYEGQSAIELEQVAVRNSNVVTGRSYKFNFYKENGVIIIDPVPLIKSIVKDIRMNRKKELIAFKFHSSVSEMIVEVCGMIKNECKIGDVVLSGGVFQNITLLQMAYKALSKKGLNVFFHSKVPANDGGLSLGQAVIANSLLKGN